MYQNAIGARVGPPGFLFTDDEFNDAGLREAVAAVARAAPADAVVFSDATGVVAEYLTMNGRHDLESRSLSGAPLPQAPAEIWAIVQEGHVYLGNEAGIAVIRRTFEKVQEFRVRGVVAVEVFRLAGRGPRTQ